MNADPPAVLVRATTPADLDYVLRLEGDPHNARFITPWSRDRHAQAIEVADERHFLFLGADSREPAGFLLFAGLLSPHARLELRRIVSDRPSRGYGRAALRWAKRWAFEMQGAHRLWLDVKTFNTVARSLYTSEGFVEEGTLRECEKGSEGCESLVLMSMLEREYRNRENREDHQS